MQVSLVNEFLLSDLIEVQKPRHLQSYLEGLKGSNNSNSDVRVSLSDNIWTFRYKDTESWVKRVKQLVSIAQGQAAVIDCGYQFRKILDASSACLVEWEDEPNWRRTYDRPINCVIYSNYSILGLTEAEKTEHRARLKCLSEMVIIGILDLSR